MKRPARIALRIVAGLGVLIAVASVLCLDTVDHQPYFKTAYYTQTSARLKTAAAAAHISHGELLAGFGRVRLSPSVNEPEDIPAAGKFRSLPLAGYGDRRGKPANGIHDDLFVKAVAFKAGDNLGVMVAADALIIPPEVTVMAIQRLQTAAGLRREQVYLGATHTHSSIGGWGEGTVAESFAGPFNRGIRPWFSDCIAAAVQAAIADLKPARFGHGQFRAPEFIRNRLVGESGRVDPEFSFVIVQQVSGKSAVIGVYGAHATVLSGDMMEFSGDYPGAWARAVEKRTGGMAMFLAGGVGSHSPVIREKGLDGVNWLGKELAGKVLEEVPRTTLTNIVSFGLLGLEVSLPELNARISDGIRLRPWLAGQLLPKDKDTFVQVFRLNDSVWFSTPCDFSGELALDLKDFVFARGGSAVVTSFNGDYIGYVIPSRYYHMNGYEPRLMSFFGPNIPDYFQEVLRNMALSVLEAEKRQ